MANRIKSRVNKSYVSFSDKCVSISISTGVASQFGKEIHKTKLFEMTDDALYKAKFSGRNKVEIAEAQQG